MSYVSVLRRVNGRTKCFSVVKASRVHGLVAMSNAYCRTISSCARVGRPREPGACTARAVVLAGYLTAYCRHVMFFLETAYSWPRELQTPLVDKAVRVGRWAK